MASISRYIDGNALRTIRAEAVSGRHTAASPYILKDVRERGLEARVQGHNAFWLIRWNGKAKTLGSLDEIVDPDEARLAAQHVRSIWRRGEDPSDYVAERRAGRSHADAQIELARRTAATLGAWTWDVLVERYVDEVVARPTVTGRGRVRPPSSKSVADARRYLGDPSLASLQGRLLLDLGRRDLEIARNEANKRSVGAQRKVVTYAKAALGWAKLMHGAASGLADVPPWWLEVRHFKHASTREQRRLTIQQIARLLLVAETKRVLPGRRIKLATSEMTLAGLWWTVLTAQRTHAAWHVRKERVEDRREQEGWYVVEWLPEHTKARRPFALPVPEAIYEWTIGRALAAQGRRADSQWVFPSAKSVRRGTGEAADLCLSDTVLNLLIRRLRGRDGVGRRVSAPDLLAGVPEFSPHDLRDSLATELSDLNLPSGAASAVLDHESSSGEDPAAREAAVTREHYTRSQRLPLKARALAAWADLVLSEYQRQYDEWQDGSRKQALSLEGQTKRQSSGPNRGRYGYEIPPDDPRYDPNLADVPVEPLGPTYDEMEADVRRELREEKAAAAQRESEEALRQEQQRLAFIRLGRNTEDEYDQ